MAESDLRVTYHRQPENIGLVNNFMWVKEHAHGSFFRWIGDDDELDPSYASRCVEVFSADRRVILVTTQLAYTGVDGTTQTMRYDGTALRSEDPICRFSEMLRLLTESHLLLDPIYGMLRREAVAGIPYYHLLHGDELFAAKLALIGPWGHVPEVLGHRHWGLVGRRQLTELLNVPPWHARVANLIQCNELLAQLREVELGSSQRWRGRMAVAEFYRRRLWRKATNRSRKLGGYAQGIFTSRPA